MTRSLYTCTIAKTGGHVPRYAVRIGRRTGDGREAREVRLTLSLHDDRESAERARERARRQPEASWRQAEMASAARERAIAERRTSPRRRGPTVIPADASPRRVAFETLPFAEDPEAVAFVEAHPDGATLDEIGEWLGVTRERIRQMEGDALRSLAMRLRLAGVTESGEQSAITWVDEGRWWG